MPLTTLGDVATMAARLPAELSKAQHRGVQQAALVVTTGIRQEIRLSSGGDMRLSGVGARGVKVGARYDIKGTTNPTAIIRATGPLHLIERKTGPHSIPRVGRRRRRRIRVLKFADGTYARSANHPGTPAKKPFEKGYIKTRDQAGVKFDLEVQKAIRVVLR